MTVDQVHALLAQHPDGLTVPELRAATGLDDSGLATVLHAAFHRQALAAVNDRIIALPDPDKGATVTSPALDDLDDYDEDCTWSTPLPDGARHAMPGDDGLVPCCGLHWDALPDGDWTTAGADLVTCSGKADR